MRPPPTPGAPGLPSVLAGLGLWSLAVLAAAAPTGADLLRACDEAGGTDYTTQAGLMCEWYVRPCDCTATYPALPRVCLPADVATEALAERVVAGLRADPRLRDLAAAEAAATALAPIFPCR